MQNREATLSGLHAGFFRSAADRPHRPALEVGTDALSYEQLRQRACALAGTLSRNTLCTHPKVGILASRSVDMYAGILGALACGGTVVPLNPGFPAERCAQMIELAELDAIVADSTGCKMLHAVMSLLTRSVLLVVPESRVDEIRAQLPKAKVMGPEPARQDWQPSDVEPEDLAYLFFTSGSTGVPKGVTVLHRNAARFVEMSMERYGQLNIGRNDRFSQFYDITFDSSMFDIFVSWACGACLCCPTTVEWVNSNKFIVERKLTVIDIVPSMGHTMNRSNGWRAGRFETLRLCRFGGEALPAELAAALASAAPHAAIDNVYGPTECTVDAAYYRWDPARSVRDAVHGVVPIGIAGPRVGLRVVDEQMNDVPVGRDGELLISGPQVTPGYWKDSDRTAQSFISLPGSGVVHYRTGDLVRQMPPGQPIPYLGRMDFQIKIAGVRIELGEVEQALRQASGTDLAVAVGWPPSPSGAAGIVGFVVKEGGDGAAIRRRLKEVLPAVMVPKDIHVIDNMPLNVNGKIDRKALLVRLKDADDPVAEGFGR
ncbi:MAG: amino acid adenylation domain-containing protein [Rubrivivax sp.]|nr:amino acid adenylation domain-containing protein [Rubrivivax sp.]